MLKTLRKHLYTQAIKDKEGVLDINNVLVVTTGNRTGRSPKDRFIVQDDCTQKTVEWNTINQPISNDVFQQLWTKTKNYLASKKTYNHNFIAGQNPDFQIQVNATTELAWHMLFLTNLLTYYNKPKSDAWELLVAPNLKLNPETDRTHSDGVVVLNLLEKKILIAGIHYSGEIKKSIFSIMNYWLPDHRVLSMHCSANEGVEGDVALFFGLSGTGKTTLSADHKRHLIGDDEHGWCDAGIFNIENGCYAKCFALSREHEPLIYNAIRDFTILENVILNEKREPDFNDASLTLNTRAAYPLEYINQRATADCSNNPTTIFMLSCDLFGVLPAVSKLTTEQALFWFLLGYTAHMGSTEHGGSGIAPTFSTCFGAPFFPRNPEVYANLLEEKINNKPVDIYLINTGYYGGASSMGGKRYPIHITREIIDYTLSGRVQFASFEQGPFNLSVPNIALHPFTTFNPMKLWSEPEQYISTKLQLRDYIKENFIKLPLTPSLQQRLLEKGLQIKITL